MTDSQINNYIINNSDWDSFFKNTSRESDFIKGKIFERITQLFLQESPFQLELIHG